MIITIDGVSGAGKTTIAKEVANKFEFKFLSTGMLYRAVALNAVELGIKSSEEDRVSDMLLNTSLRVGEHCGETIIVLNGYDVTDELNQVKVESRVAEFSQQPKVRKFVRAIQYDFANKSADVIVEGRDIGSVVFPNADLKFFLDCDVKVRAKRRKEQLTHEKGKHPEIAQILSSLEARDEQDKNRELCPLVVPNGAIVVDSTKLSKEQTIEKIAKQVERQVELNKQLADEYFAQYKQFKCRSQNPKISANIKLAKFEQPFGL